MTSRRPGCRSVLALLGLALGLLALGNRATAQPISTDHPRVILTPADLEAVRAGIGSDPYVTEVVDEMSRYMTRQLANRPLSDGRITAGEYQFMALTAFVARVTDRADVIAEAHHYLAIANALPPGEVNVTRLRLFGLALAYDWLYPYLTDTERTTTIASIIAYIASLDELLDMADPNFVAGPSRWAHVTALAGALAIHHDDDTLDAQLLTIVDHWENGYNPALAVMGVGGAHPMGWYYGSGYSGTEPVLMWRSATGVTWNEEFLRESAYFHLYSANGALEAPLMEDAGNEHITQSARDQVFFASTLGNGHAESFAQDLDAMDVEPQHRIVRLVTRARAAAAVPLDTLPLSRWFSGAGFLVARDEWAREDATTLVFKASPFYSQGHHQRDEGSFVVDYRGPLLVDAGYYDATTGTQHYRNFFARTVAHNALLVHWDAEPAVGFFLPDGGQEQRLEPHTAAQLTEPPHALRGMVGHGDVGACVWGRADLGDTYASSKLTTYTRDLLEVRRPGGAAHPAILVVDRAALPRVAHASVLWHFNDPATRVGSRISVANAGGGHARLDVLRPAAPRFAEFTGTDRFRTDSGVWEPDAIRASQTWVYWGRIEVSPEVDETQTTWSTLVRVGDATLASDTQSPIDVGGSDWLGARLEGTLFAIAAETTTELVLPDGAPLVDGCVAGLEPSGTVTVRVGDDAPVTIFANGDGIALYDPSGTPPADAGTSIDGGSTSGVDGGPGVDASASGDGGPRADSGAAATAPGAGCGCRAAGTHVHGAWLALALLGLAGASRRGRSR